MLASVARRAVGGKHMTNQQELLAFYKFIYSARIIQPMAAKSMAEAAETMEAAARQLFYAMQFTGCCISAIRI